MPKGTVTFVHRRDNYGFIESDDLDEEIFFHQSFIDGPDLEEDEEVEFDVEQDEKGPRAANLHRA